MKIKQVSVFAENQPGRFLAVLQALKAANINLHAASISENAEFGIVRMIMDDPEKGAAALKKAGFTGRTDMLISAEIPDVPSGLLKNVIEPLAAAGVNIDYFYAFIEQKPGTARIVLKTSDDDKAEKALKGK